MKPQTAKEVYDEIVAYMKLNDGKYSNWYCGIASDWEDRLFNEHQIPRPPKDYWWRALQCYDNESARNVEKALLELGCDGGAGGGDDTTVYVYAYLKGTMTNP